MMNTEVILILFCLMAITICNSIPITKTEVMDVPLNETEYLKGVPDLVPHTSLKSQARTNDITTVLPSVHNSDKRQDRAAGLCSNLNPEQELLCRHAVIANSKLDQLYNLVNNLIRIRLFPLGVQLASQEVDDNCTMNVTTLTADLGTAVTAVCLLGNVSGTTEAIGGCCHSDSRVEEEFQQFTNFVQTNLFRLLIKDYPMNTVEPICVGKNVNVIWLVRQITRTLQKTKQLINDVDSHQCLLHA